MDSDFLEWFGAQDDFPFIISSSTVPSLMTQDNLIDHRLYNHVPYQVGKILEIPLSVYDGRMECWLRPTPGFGLLDNCLEMMRMVEILNMSFDAAELSSGATPHCLDDQAVYAMKERLEVLMWYARRQNFKVKSLCGIDIETEVVGV